MQIHLWYNKIGDDMKHDIKIAFFDLDGTLTNNSKEITEVNKKALQLLHDHQVIIALASGRNYAYMKKIAQELGCCDYLIANNGAIISDGNGQFIYQANIKKDLVNDMWSYAKDHHIGIILNGINNCYENNFCQINWPNIITLDDINELPEDVYQIIYNTLEHDKVNHLINYIQRKQLTISYISKVFFQKILDAPVSVDVNDFDISKGKSITILLDKLNISKEDSLCFGDNFNDIGMFESCGIKVAMENAHPDVKKHATYVTKSNEEDGISYFINNYIKNKKNNE